MDTYISHHLNQIPKLQPLKFSTWPPIPLFYFPTYYSTWTFPPVILSNAPIYTKEALHSLPQWIDNEESWISQS